MSWGNSTSDINDRIWSTQRQQSKIMWQFIVKWALWTVGTLYIFIEKFRNYPNEERDNILGLKIDPDLQKLSRFQLCSYMTNLVFINLKVLIKLDMGS